MPSSSRKRVSSITRKLLDADVVEEQDRGRWGEIVEAFCWEKYSDPDESPARKIERIRRHLERGRMEEEKGIRSPQLTMAVDSH